MGDHFVLVVDRLLTESTLEAVIQSNYRLQNATTSAYEDMDTDFSSHRMDIDAESKLGKLVECRICHDEDEDLNMETPCSCSGSLKYAHRRCVQRWCNEKGNTVCEICRQQFKPGYTAPPPMFNYAGIPVNFRGNWEISRSELNLHNAHLIAMIGTDRNPVEPEYDDYIARSSNSLMCCRIIAIIFMVLLVLRHTLPLILTGAGEYTITLFTLVMLRTVAILLPVFIMVRAFTAIHRRRQRNLRNAALATSDEDNDQEMQSRPHLIRIY